MNMSSKVFVRLIILSRDFSPDELNAVIGVQSDESWKIGECRGASPVKQKENGWILKSGLGDGEPLEMHLESLLEHVGAVSANIRKLSENEIVEISCAVYSEEVPSLNFEKRLVGRIADLGASLDIDLYIL